MRNFLFIAISIFYLSYICYNIFFKIKVTAKKLSQTELDIQIDSKGVKQANDFDKSIKFEGAASVIKLNDDIWLAVNKISCVPVKFSEFENGAELKKHIEKSLLNSVEESPLEDLTEESEK